MKVQSNQNKIKQKTLGFHRYKIEETSCRKTHLPTCQLLPRTCIARFCQVYRIEPNVVLPSRSQSMQRCFVCFFDFLCFRWSLISQLQYSSPRELHGPMFMIFYDSMFRRTSWSFTSFRMHVLYALEETFANVRKHTSCTSKGVDGGMGLVDVRGSSYCYCMYIWAIVKTGQHLKEDQFGTVW